MRVLLLTDADIFAGTERHILALAQSVPRDRIEPAIGCPVPSPLARRAAAAGIRVVPIAKRALVDFAAIGALRRMLASGEIDIIHAHNGRTTLSAAIAVCMARRGRCLATEHFLSPGHLCRRGVGGFIYRMAHGWVNRRVDHFIAISAAVRDAMLARGHASAIKISTIPNGIQPPGVCAFVPVSRVRAALGIAGDAPLIACAARLEQEKGIASLVLAMRQVVDSCPAARCVIAGEGAQRNAIAALIDQCGLRESVLLVGFREEVLSIMAAADLFVLPSLAEPFGLALLEAMALEKATVATRAGGPMEIVADGETGLLVPPADPAALAQALLRLLNDKSLCRAMGRAGKRRFESHFTAAGMGEATAGVYEKALRNSST